MVGQVSCTGSEGPKLPEVVNLNHALPGTGDVNKRRPLQGFANVQFYGPLVNSNYHALLGKLKRRFSKGVTMLASYTYGHLLMTAEAVTIRTTPTRRTRVTWLPSADRRTSTFANASF